MTLYKRRKLRRRDERGEERKQILWNKIPNRVKLTCDSLQEKEIKKKRWERRGEETWYYPRELAVFFFFKEFLFVAKLAISFIEYVEKVAIILRKYLSKFGYKLNMNFEKSFIILLSFGYFLFPHFFWLKSSKLVLKYIYNIFGNFEKNTCIKHNVKSFFLPPSRATLQNMKGS